MPAGRRRAAVVTFALIVGVAVVGWLAARNIRSPARIAAETAPPPPSPITVPVQRLALSTQVIVRGTVRFGAPRPVVLGTSGLKAGATRPAASDIVTRPPLKGTKLTAGATVMAVDARPVFVLRGAVPMHRDLVRGDLGPDVAQLEAGLARVGFDPGTVDGRYDAGTQAAVARFYRAKGYDPFGATDTQLDQLRTAEAAAAAARDAHLQAVAAIAQARQTPTPADVQQARVDAVVARDTLDTAELAVTTARTRVAQTQALAATAPGNPGVVSATGAKDQATADADVAAKRAALTTATDEQRNARLRAQELPFDAKLSERDAAFAAVAESGEKVAQAQAELHAAEATAAAVAVTTPQSVRQAQDDAAQAQRDAQAAAAELRRALVGVRNARRQARISAHRARVIARPTDVRAMRAVAASTLRERRRTRADVTRLARQSGIAVPANELLFFPTLPVRVDAVKAKRGDAIAGKVMDATSSRLEIDSSLSVSDRQLVHVGDRVTIEDQDLGITTHGVVRAIGNSPGATPAGVARIDPSRFYMAIVPGSGPSSLVGASVKLTIDVRSTRGRVLAVPVSAVSVGGNGNARVEVRRGTRIDLVTVVPGLAADGLVEMRRVGGRGLRPGDLVVVGSRDGARPFSPSGGGP